MPVSELEPWPGNPRRGNREAIRESIEANGVYKPLLVQRGTRRVLVGNNTLAVARELGIAEIDVIYKNVNDDAARRIMLADNRTGDLGEYDEERLRESFLAMDSLAGTGWSAQDVDAIMERAQAEQDAGFEVELGFLGDDEVLVLEDVPTGADWAELPQQTEARAERQAAQTVSAVKGVREIMLVYPTEEHAEMIRLLEGLKKAAGGEARNPQIVQGLVRRAAREVGLL